MHSIIKTAELYKVQLEVWPDFGSSHRVMSHHMPCIQKRGQKKWDFLECNHRVCNAIKNGKFYPCQRILKAKHLEKRFGVVLPVVAEDSIEIFEHNA